MRLTRNALVLAAALAVICCVGGCEQAGSAKATAKNGTSQWQVADEDGKNSKEPKSLGKITTKDSATDGNTVGQNADLADDDAARTKASGSGARRGSSQEEETMRDGGSADDDGSPRKIAAKTPGPKTRPAAGDDEDSAAGTVPTRPHGDEAPTEEQVPLLAIGDLAPPLAIGTWVKGDAVKKFEPGKIYVVEFWATWCGPCLQSMPHLAELQDELREHVTCIGISDEDAETVQTFLERERKPSVTWNDTLTYTIALDDEQQTNRAYMLASKQNGIPTAFLVGKDGRVEWIGHPMEMEQPLHQLVEGTYDREKVMAEIAEKKQLEQEMMLLQKRLSKMLDRGDMEGALEEITAAVEKHPDETNLRLAQFQLLLQAKGPKEAMPALEELTNRKEVWDNPGGLFQIAGLAVQLNREGDKKMLRHSLKMLERASELTDGEQPVILHTIATVYEKLGDFAQALKWETDALAKGEGKLPENAIEDLKASIEKYKEKAAQPGNEPKDAADEPAKPETKDGAGDNKETDDKDADK